MQYTCTVRFLAGWTDPRGFYGSSEEADGYSYGIDQAEMWRRGYCPVLNKLSEDNKPNDVHS